MPAGPQPKLPNITPSYTCCAGAARTRSETVVITPSVPSEPTISSRNPGPAALAGIAASVMSPAGAAICKPSTILAMFPYPLEACPADLLAAHPPSVTYS